MIQRFRTAAGLALGLALTSAGAFAQEGKWESLFDGKTLSGWEVLDMGPKGSSHWDVKDGALVSSGTQSMLVSPRGDYKNFKFRAEIKINDHGNSGMYVRTKKKATFSEGYEIQINSNHTDPIRTGSLYTMVHLFKELAPPDTWFTQEVEVVTKNYRGKVIPHFKVKVNGDLLYEFLDHTDQFQSGHFAFQQHDPKSSVSVRKIEVMELPDTPPSPAVKKKSAAKTAS